MSLQMCLISIVSSAIRTHLKQIFINSRLFNTWVYLIKRVKLKTEVNTQLTIKIKGKIKRVNVYQYFKFFCNFRRFWVKFFTNYSQKPQYSQKLTNIVFFCVNIRVWKPPWSKFKQDKAKNTQDQEKKTLIGLFACFKYKCYLIFAMHRSHLQTLSVAILQRHSFTFTCHSQPIHRYIWKSTLTFAAICCVTWKPLVIYIQIYYVYMFCVYLQDS